MQNPASKSHAPTSDSELIYVGMDIDMKNINKENNFLYDSISQTRLKVKRIWRKEAESEKKKLKKAVLQGPI